MALSCFSWCFLGVFVVSIILSVGHAARPTIVSRQGWGARTPKSKSYLSGKQPLPFVYIHHSASGLCFSQAACIKKVKSFQNYHMDNKGWSDIGYSFLIGGNGEVYEGRGWDRVGAHTLGHNTDGLGFCLIGNFQTASPSAAQIKATKELIALGISLKKISASYRLLGHKDVVATACPGTKLYSLIKAWPHYGRSHAARPTIVSRQGWGARTPKSISYLSGKQPLPFVYIHHSDTGSCFSQSACSKRVRGFQYYHMYRRGWSDIGYSFLIGGNGMIYEGRGWDRVGAHTLGHNSDGLGFCLIGDFQTASPSAAQIKATKELIALGVSLKKISANYRLLGHKDVVATACPGAKLYSLIKTWPHYGRL